MHVSPVILLYVFFFLIYIIFFIVLHIIELYVTKYLS